MLPASPSPWTTLTPFINCGKSFGSKALESVIKALNMRDGAIGHEYSKVKVVTPIVNFVDYTNSQGIKVVNIGSGESTFGVL